MRKTRKMSPEIAGWIKWIHTNYPKFYQDQIAAILNVNGGRVCEVLSGKRYTDTLAKRPPSLYLRIMVFLRSLHTYPQDRKK